MHIGNPLQPVIVSHLNSVNPNVNIYSFRPDGKVFKKYTGELKK